MKLLLPFLLAWSLSAQAQKTEPFEVVTADLNPYAIDNHPEAPGALVELVELLSKRLGHEQNVSFFPWARAVAIAQNQQRTAILPFTRSPERENKFQWLVKLYPVRFVFITRSDQSKPAQTEEQARKLSITVLRGALNYDQLVNHGFDKASIIQETTIDNAFKALDHGMVDAFYGPEAVGLMTLNKTGRKLSDYKVGLMLEQNEIWLAAGKGFSEADIKLIQSSFDAMKKEGIYARVLKKYKLPE